MAGLPASCYALLFLLFTFSLYRQKPIAEYAYVTTKPHNMLTVLVKTVVNRLPIIILWQYKYIADINTNTAVLK